MGEREPRFKEPSVTYELDNVSEVVDTVRTKVSPRSLVLSLFQWRIRRVFQESSLKEISMVQRAAV